MTYDRKNVLFLCTLMIPSVTFANQITLENCLKRAKSKAPEIVQAILAERRSQSLLNGVRSSRLPQMYAVGTYDVSDDVQHQLPDANKGVLRIEQSFPFSNSWIMASQKEVALKVSKLATVETRADVILTVKQLYFSILKDSETLKNYQLVSEQLKKLQQTILPKYNVGRIQPFDLVKVRTSLLDLTRARDLVLAQLASEKTTLTQLAGIDAATNDIDLAPLTSEIPIEAASTLFSFQTLTSPSITLLNETVHASELGLSASRRLRYPLLTSAIEYGYTGQTFNSQSLGWDFSIGLKVPLFDWGNISSQVEIEESNVALSQSKLEIAKNKIEADLVLTKALLDSHLSDYKRLKDILLEVHRGALVSISRYRQGASPILEVSDSVNLWLQTLLNQSSAFYAYLSDIAKLERLSGNEIIKYD